MGFPDQQVYPSLGNHESQPVNNFPDINIENEEFSISWLYQGLAQIYGDWLSDDALETFRRAGFYSQKVEPSLRIIAINSNKCEILNFWLNVEWVDPDGQLAWLVDQLAEAEAAGEKVHIISHVPPGKVDCYGSWAREFSKIINRFESTVVAQFYGHTHFDEFVVFYDEETNSRASNVGFITPSVTTYTEMNMAYRIFILDQHSHRVLNYETYVADLNEANFGGSESRPRYRLFYEGTTGLETKSLFPRDMDGVARRLAVDDRFYFKFNRFFNSDGPGKGLEKSEIICGLVTSSNNDKRKCQEILGPDFTP